MKFSVKFFVVWLISGMSSIFVMAVMDASPAQALAGCLAGGLAGAMVGRD